MNIDLNQIEAMTTTELEAHYGRLETEAFRLRVAISAVSLELEARIKSRRQTPLGVEERTASGDTRLNLKPRSPPAPTNPRAWGKCVCGLCEECKTDPYDSPLELSPALKAHNDGLHFRARRSDAGVPRGPIAGPRALDHSSCCGAEGRRMNTETLDCAACREVVE